MIALALAFAFACVAVALAAGAWRFLRGPTWPDRMLAADTVGVNLIVAVLLGGIALDSSLYFETALLVAILNFVGTAALAKLFLHGDVMR